MKSTTLTASSSLFVLLTLLATTASATPGLFDDIHSDFDAEKTKVEDAWSSATASTTSTSSSSSTTTTTTATATAYPGCTSSSANSWCGVTINTQQNPSATNSTPSSYNITITDSKCNQVGSKTGVKPNMGVSFDTSVGNWEFGVYPTEQGLSLTYEGRNVSDYKSWQNWGYQYLNYTAGDVMVYGGITNCTSASSEKSSSTSDGAKDSSSKNSAATLTAGTGWMLAALGFGMTALL